MVIFIILGRQARSTFCSVMSESEATWYQKLDHFLHNNRTHWILLHNVAVNSHYELHNYIEVYVKIKKCTRKERQHDC